MKYLYLIRHAKSDWSDGSSSDFDRGLNARGEKAILTMAKALSEQNIIPDCIIASSAKRAKRTAEGIAKELGYQGNITLLNELYLADTSAIQQIIKEADDQYDRLFIVGHNPDMTELGNMMIDEFIDNIPTLGIVGLNLPIEQWSEFSGRSAKMEFFIYPKMYKDG